MAVTIDLSGKKAVIFGVANHHSNAWSIAKRLSDAGAELAFAYYGEKLKGAVAKLAELIGSTLVFECDARDAEQVKEVYKGIGEKWGGIDYVVHSVAYADRAHLGGRFSIVTREGFRVALESSAYSFINVVAQAEKLFGTTGGAAITLSFDASSKVYPGYNIMGTAKAALENIVRQLAAEYGPMGVRVNALSPGPISTLAARGVPGFNEMKKIHRQLAPLKRNITNQEVGEAALFMLSDMSSGITGVILPVDAGCGIMANYNTADNERAEERRN